MGSERKDDRLNLRISRELKKAVQEYCDRRSIDLSELTTRFFERIVENEKKRKEQDQ